MQSNIGDVYSQIKKILEDGQFVLFSGCPCQVAGLNAFLGKSYEKLLTVDLICHGVPSPKVFQKFLKEVSGNTEIDNVDFREKEVFGWCSQTTIKLKNGEIYRKAFNVCSYFKGFLANLFLNKPCGNCDFNKIPRQADITLGDFWHIREYNEKYTDGKGTGLVLVSSKKGEFFIDKVKSKLKLFDEVPMQFALKSNPNLNCSFKHHPNRDLFFKYLENNTYEDAFKYANNEKYDIGLMGLGWADNYGAALTNFGMVKTLELLGQRVLVIDRPKEYKTQTDLNVTRKFNYKYFNVSAEYDKQSVLLLNELCDTFMVGSDQVWHWNVLQAFREYFLLEFALESKRKIAYASSFGHYNLTAPTSFKYMFSYLLSRFDAVSVRESSGVDICKNLGITAKHVLDPVFLCDRNEYIKLADSVDSKYEKDKYIFTYILDPHRGDKKNVLLNVSNYTNLPLFNVTDLHDQDKREEWLGLPVEKSLDIEYLLSNIYNSKFIITDSFHGVCFAIIFKKKFICLANKGRGIARFESLMYKLGLQDRLFYNPEDFAGHEDLIDKDIDYDNIYRIIEKEKESSYEFLKTALRIQKEQTSCSSFDALNLYRLKLSQNKNLECDNLKQYIKYSKKEKKYRFKYAYYRLFANFCSGKLKEKIKFKKAKYKKIVNILDLY